MSGNWANPHLSTHPSWSLLFHYDMILYFHQVVSKYPPFIPKKFPNGLQFVILWSNSKLRVSLFLASFFWQKHSTLSVVPLAMFKSMLFPDFSETKLLYGVIATSTAYTAANILTEVLIDQLSIIFLLISWIKHSLRYIVFLHDKDGCEEIDRPSPCSYARALRLLRLWASSKLTFYQNHT